MSTAAIAIIAFALMSIGAGFGWIAHHLVAREQSEDELAQFHHGWNDRP